MSARARADDSVSGLYAPPFRTELLTPREPPPPPRNRALFIWAASTRGQAVRARRMIRRARGGFFDAALVAVAPLLAEIIRRRPPDGARVDATAAEARTARGRHDSRLSLSFSLMASPDRQRSDRSRHPYADFRRLVPAPRGGQLGDRRRRNSRGKARGAYLGPPPLPPPAESARPAEIRRDPLANFENGGRGTFGERKRRDASRRRYAATSRHSTTFSPLARAGSRRESAQVNYSSYE